MASLVVGLISYFTSQYTYSIWFQTNTIPDLIDTIVSLGIGWRLAGLLVTQTIMIIYIDPPDRQNPIIFRSVKILPGKGAFKVSALPDLGLLISS